MTSANWAFRVQEYGGPENVKRDEVPIPQLAPDQLLVRVAAASVNPVDWRWRSGFFRAPVPLSSPRIWARSSRAP